MVKKGLDVSSYQDPFPYSAVKTDFAIIRAGFTGWGAGTLNVDKAFDRHYEGFTRQKIPLGAYWYSCANSIKSAQEEAKFFLTLLKGKKFAYPIYMDVEDPNRTGKLPRAEITKIVRAFCEVIEDAGYYVGVYANKYWWTNLLEMDALKDFDRWVAHYGVNTPGVAGEVWQFTEKGELPGYTGPLDLNYSYKDYPAIIQKAGLNGYGTPPKVSQITVKGSIGAGNESKAELIRALMKTMGFEVG